MKSVVDKKEMKKLKDWFLREQRELPWRKTRDPYLIWISETMLQQTTTTAVVPYFEKFIEKFPTLEALANAPIEFVLEAWAGLGYYSRARNLHKAALALQTQKLFPQTAEELIKFPGFGPYTSRAVSSIAFNEPVGVLDGNVIRVLSRYYNLSTEWWKVPARRELQSLSDEIAQCGESRIMNQALMELGASLCRPVGPKCFLCPLNSSCKAVKKKNQETLPLKKPKRKQEYWRWDVYLLKNKKDQWALVKNETMAPFLRGQFLFPSKTLRLKKKPKDFQIKHNITHHDIYIFIHHKTMSEVVLSKNTLFILGEERFHLNKQSVELNKQSIENYFKEIQWVSLEEINQTSPFSVMKKILSKRALSSNGHL